MGRAVPRVSLCAPFSFGVVSSATKVGHKMASRSLGTRINFKARLLLGSSDGCHRIPDDG